MKRHCSVVEAVSFHARAQPDRIAIAAGDRKLTYAELWERVQAASQLIAGQGAQPGEAIVLSSTSGQLPFALGYLGAHLAGCCVVPTDPQLPEMALLDLTQKVGAKLVFVRNPKRVSSIVTHALDSFDSAPSTNASFSFPADSDVADILFTSGTTGSPKGVVLTHENVLSAAININAFIGNGSEDIEVLPLPLSHSFGLGRLRCCLIAGGTIVLTTGFSFPGVITKAIEQWKATGFASVPAGFAVLFRIDSMVLKRFESQLKYIEIGSAPMPERDKLQLIEMLPTTRICMHYGLTEASRSAFIEFHEHTDHLSSVGRSSPNVSIRIVNNNGEGCATNQSGKIHIKGAHVMQGYFQDATATQAVLKDGWLDSCDFGHLDQEGFIYLEGREAELINVGGKKVSPLEVERQIMNIPGIEECACVAAPDTKGVTGATVKAFLVADPSFTNSPEIRDITIHLKNYLEPHKIPTQWEWRDTLPRTNSGKLQRAALWQDLPLS